MKSRVQSRRGFTLVECLMACAIAVVVLSVVTAVVGPFLSSSMTSTRNLERTVNLARLAEMLRHDAHGATSLQVDQAEDGARLRLELPNGRQVTYTLAPEQVSRRILDEDRSEPPEDFALHGMRLLEWQQSPGEVALVLAFVAHPGTEIQTLRNKFRLVASLASGHAAAEAPRQ